MNIRCKQKFMFCKNRVRDFSVWLCKGYVGYARPARGFQFYHPTLFGFPICRSLEGKRSLSNASTVIEN